ncbi:uncharacterized protein VTP21DRAFT_9498 [Calcarisporiella thermophila]|uniref:uncharacterized protein n=1 Tax=Calcarisporiella thermophila TaxID=911321 RepID=UPI003741EC8E
MHPEPNKLRACMPNAQHDTCDNCFVRTTQKETRRVEFNQHVFNSASTHCSSALPGLNEANLAHQYSTGTDWGPTALSEDKSRYYLSGNEPYDTTFFRESYYPPNSIQVSQPISTNLGTGVANAVPPQVVMHENFLARTAAGATSPGRISMRMPVIAPPLILPPSLLPSGDFSLQNSREQMMYPAQTNRELSEVFADMEISNSNRGVVGAVPQIYSGDQGQQSMLSSPVMGTGHRRPICSLPFFQVHGQRDESISNEGRFLRGNIEKGAGYVVGTEADLPNIKGSMAGFAKGSIQHQQEKRSSEEENWFVSHERVEVFSSFGGKGEDYLPKLQDDSVNIETGCNEMGQQFSKKITDELGSVECEKLFTLANDEQRTVLLESVAGEILDVATNRNGSKALIKLIKQISIPQHIQILSKAISNHTAQLIKGNHVIRQWVESRAPPDKQFVYDILCQRCIELATNRDGCIVFQHCIRYASSEQKAQLFMEAIIHAHALIQDKNGNFLIQYIVELNYPQYSEMLIRQFFGKVCRFGMQKFSSNAIEKCIERASDESRRRLISELFNRSQLECMLCDPYGNYVVLTALKFADKALREKLIGTIEPFLPTLSQTPYCKKISQYIRRLRAGTHR